MLLRYNVKGYSDTLKIRGRTVVVGKNRTGKTAIRDAIRLAITGKHPGLFELVGTESGVLQASIEDIDGSSSYLHVEGGSAEHKVSGEPFRLGEIGDQLKGDRLCRESLFRRFGMSRSEPFIPGGLTDAQKALWTTVYRSDLANASAAFRSEKMRLGKEIKAAERMLADAPVGVGAELLGELENAMIRTQEAADLARKRMYVGTAYLLLADLIRRDEAPSWAIGIDPDAIEADVKPQHDQAASEMTHAMDAEDAAKQSYESALAALRQREQADALAESLGALRAKQADCKALEKIATDLMTADRDKVRGATLDAVNQYMPRGFRAELLLDAKHCQWQVIGTDGMPHGKHTMAGSERATLINALIMAWGADIIVLDDEELTGVSGENLTRLMEMLGEHVDSGQLTSVVVLLDPDRAERIPKTGWIETHLTAEED